MGRLTTNDGLDDPSQMQCDPEDALVSGKCGIPNSSMREVQGDMLDCESPDDWASWLVETSHPKASWVHDLAEQQEPAEVSVLDVQTVYLDTLSSPGEAVCIDVETEVPIDLFERMLALRDVVALRGAHTVVYGPSGSSQLARV